MNESLVIGILMIIQSCMSGELECQVYDTEIPNTKYVTVCVESEDGNELPSIAVSGSVLEQGGEEEILYLIPTCKPLN